jgi:hypothetical protein
MEEDPEAGESIMNLHIKRNCSDLKTGGEIVAGETYHTSH